jgi:hypothetical protein
MVKDIHRLKGRILFTNAFPDPDAASWNRMKDRSKRSMRS